MRFKRFLIFKTSKMHFFEITVHLYIGSNRHFPHIYCLCRSFFLNTVDPVYSERVGAAKKCSLKCLFTINVFNLTIN